MQKSVVSRLLFNLLFSRKLPVDLPKKKPWGLSGARFSLAGCPFRHGTSSVKMLKGMIYLFVHVKSTARTNNHS